MSDTTATSKYQLAPAYAGQTFNHEDFAGTLTADNLTDEGAEFFIKHGYEHAFTARDNSDATATEAASPAAAGATPTDHAKGLEAERKAHATTTGKLQKEKEAHAKTSDALKAEKDAHKATKKEVTEVSRQLTEAQEQLAALAQKAGDAATDADATK